VPLALFGALYTSQFLSPSLRNVIKPLVEVMAALPSVVIGFLAGLWLAPALENQLPALLFFSLLVPVVVLAVTAAWRVAPKALKRAFPEGREVFVLVPLVVACLWASVALGPSLDGLFFHGDVKQWVYDTFAVRVEQRNSIVVGIAMGFAVIPMIFTISDDAFTNVPRSFTSASLALGASRWQTAVRVIAPTASPGVFSAVMIGFGRAVGETMIVLMATGNTPVLSFSPFNGMRTLSANIAVEIPEAPLGETHYRILFLAAFLLFLLTFIVNTAAETVRQRLREKYQAV
jgi:phosphate transport system permease protein